MYEVQGKELDVFSSASFEIRFELPADGAVVASLVLLNKIGTGQKLENLAGVLA